MNRFRADRFVSLRLVRPLRALVRHAPLPSIPILMYHSIQEGSSDRRRYHDINISPKRFAEQMEFLRDSGYRTIELDSVAQTLVNGPKDSKHVIITFDDGYRNFLTEGYQSLSAFGHGAVMYVASGLIQEERGKFNGRECLNWNELRELRSKGIEIGSHSVTHPELRHLGLARVKEELGRSKKIIEDKIGHAVTSFAYPYAFPEAETEFVKTFRHLVESEGYHNCVTTILGRTNSSSDVFLLPRLPINSWDDLDLFRAKLEGSYDWLHSAQYASKCLEKLKPARRVQEAAAALKS